MRVLILDDNLMWYPRLVKTVQSLGYEAVVVKTVPDEMPTGDVAIVNLGNAVLGSPEVVASLKANSTKVIAHAGHKEKDLLTNDAAQACDLIASNGQLTFKLGELIEKVIA